MKTKNSCCIEGYIVKDSIQIRTSSRGTRFGQFTLSFPKTDESWQYFDVTCAEWVANNLLEAGYAKDSKNRKRIRVEGEMDNIIRADINGKKSSHFTIKHANVFDCGFNFSGKKPSDEYKKASGRFVNPVKTSNLREGFVDDDLF